MFRKPTRLDIQLRNTDKFSDVKVEEPREDQNRITRCDEMLKIMAQMFREGNVPVDSHRKCIVCMADEYTLGGRPDIGFKLLEAIPESYFLQVQPVQIKNDEDYGHVVRSVTMNLLALGYHALDMPKH